MNRQNRLLALCLALYSVSTLPTLANESSGLSAKEEMQTPCKLMLASAAANETKAKKNDPWWKTGVIYEIYPRSFADSNNDGIGDLNGITSKLDYLKDLGVDAIWITPCYPSPQVDFGYDISDYTAIAPEYGTLADFDKLVAEAKKRNIRIIMDLVMNHSSDKHKWFLESKSSKTNPKRDWYIWRDGKAEGQPPNNWQSLFGHSAWKFDPTTKQYYYHFFYPEQPDMNWRNPELKKAMFDAVRFWLDHGVAGFRLDAIGTLFEDPNFPDNPVKEGVNVFGDPNTEYKYNDKLPEVHDILKELRAVLDSYPGDRVLIGECSEPSVEALSKMFGKNHDEIQLPMNFPLAFINKLSAPEFRKQILEWDKNPAGGQPLYFFSNHDQVRHNIRYGDGTGKSKDEIAKLMGTLLLTVRGTPILYYGEELGMENNNPTRVEDVQDPIGKLGWPKEKGRDGERTPMQWNDTANGGFSTSKPWLPVPASAKTYNVKSEEGDSNSILNFYRKLIHIRNTEPAMRSGSFELLNDSDPNILSYLRKSDKESILVALNMTDKAQKIKFNMPTLKSAATLLYSTDAAASKSSELKELELPAYGTALYKIEN